MQCHPQTQARRPNSLTPCLLAFTRLACCPMAVAPCRDGYMARPAMSHLPIVCMISPAVVLSRRGRAICRSKSLVCNPRRSEQKGIRPRMVVTCSHSPSPGCHSSSREGSFFDAILWKRAAPVESEALVWICRLDWTATPPGKIWHG